MVELHHEELSAIHETSLLAILARQKEKILEADREWRDIKTHLAWACRQQDDILHATAVAAADARGEIAPDMDATEGSTAGSLTTMTMTYLEQMKHLSQLCPLCLSL